MPRILEVKNSLNADSKVTIRPNPNRANSSSGSSSDSDNNVDSVNDDSPHSIGSQENDDGVELRVIFCSIV